MIKCVIYAADICTHPQIKATGILSRLRRRKYLLKSGVFRAASRFPNDGSLSASPYNQDKGKLDDARLDETLFQEMFVRLDI